MCCVDCTTLDLVSEVLFSFINLVMKLAPLGTFGAVAYSVGSNGTAVLIALAQLVVSFYAVVVLFIVVVMGIMRSSRASACGAFCATSRTRSSSCSVLLRRKAHCRVF
jgi:Na+/H+-dicarboxylate symporter